ncbi:hypothetical protein JCM11251_006655 [Rhodosporidiobolus azoricus]
MSDFIGRRGDARRDDGTASGGGAGAVMAGMASYKATTAGLSSQQPPPPALPDDLLDALAREPPPSPPATANPPPVGRSSLSFSRPSQPPPSAASSNGSFASALPSLPPQSPFGLSYPASPASTGQDSLGKQQQVAAMLQQQLQSEQKEIEAGQLGGFSTNRTASSASSAASSRSHSPSLARPTRASPFFASSPSKQLGSALTQANSTHPALPRTGSGNILSAFSSSSTPSSSSSNQAQPQQDRPSSSKRHMFKSFGFGRSASTSPTHSRQTSPAPPPPQSSLPPPPQQYLPTLPTPWQRSPSPSSPSASSANARAGTQVPSVPPGTFASSPTLSRQSSYLRPAPADSPALGAWPDSPIVGGSARRSGTIGGGGAGVAGEVEEYVRDLELGRAPEGEESEAEQMDEEGEEGEGAAAKKGKEEGEEEPLTPKGGKAGEPVLRGVEQELDFANLSACLPSPLSLASSAPPPLADFVIAVVGPRNVGKSSVIKRGLLRKREKDRAEVVTEVLVEDQNGNRATSTTTSFLLATPSPPRRSSHQGHAHTSSASSTSSTPPHPDPFAPPPRQPSTQPKGERRTIQILEIDMQLLRYSKEGVVWPEGVPQCEGAMLCYDSTDPTSLTSLSTLLRSFWTRGSDVPLIVLACKAPPPNSPPSSGEVGVDPKEAAAICNVYGAGIVQLDGGLEDPKRKTKECFNWLIRQIMDNRGEILRPPSSASTYARPDSYVHTHSLSYSASHSASQPRAPSSPSSRRHSPRTSTSALHSASSSAAPPSPADADPTATPSGGPTGRKDSLGLGLSVVQESPVGDASASAAFPSSSSPALAPVSASDAAKQAALEAEADAALRAAFDEAEDEGAGGGGGGEPLKAGGTGQSAVNGGAGGPENVQHVGSTDGLKAGVILPQPGATAERRKSTKTAALDLYFKREDLIDKFLFAAVSGNDEQFTTLFLITYRRFARPYDVLEKLIERFDFVASRHKTDPLLSRYGQLKLCGVLSTWMTHYPGDFTSPSTFSLLQPFLESLLPRGATWVAHYALELVPLLAPISAMADPESSWALPDKPLNEPEEEGEELVTPHSNPQQQPRPSVPRRRPSLAPSYDSSSSLAPSSSLPLSQSVSRLSIPGSVDTTDTSASTGASPVLSGNTHSHSPHPASEAGTLDTQDSTDAFSGPPTSASGGVAGGSDSLGSSSGALGRTAVGRYPNSAVLVDVSNAVLEMREEDVAMQITRIAWEMFGGMSPRDLLRHVLAPRDPANPRVALRDSESNVMRSIAFVNHLAAWTSTLILVQSRPKQRARMLEKMLLIAVSLREKENFDGLMGVLAGLNSQPVFRLSETFEIVATKLDGPMPQRAEMPDGDKTRLPKKLRSLNRLMAANKAFAAYRLALANSGINMIPYLGVHLQDITVVNEVKSDLRDGLVNWSKFQQVGRSAAIVLDCARVAPQLPVDRTIERCILHVPVLDDDQQYKLSYAHHPRQGGRTGTRARLKEMGKAAMGL